MPELVFEVVQESDGGYCAECLTENIFTEGDTWEELRSNVIEATAAFFFDRPQPERIRLHLVRDEILHGARLSPLALTRKLTGEEWAVGLRFFTDLR